MKPHRYPLLPCLLLLSGPLAETVSLAAQPVSQSIPANWRNIASGWTIPDEDYADQPYIVKADDGAWV